MAIEDELRIRLGTILQEVASLPRPKERERILNDALRAVASMLNIELVETK